MDYVELVDLVTEDYDLVYPYLFDSHAPDDEKTDFYEFLRRDLGFRVVSLELGQTNEHPTEKGVDVALATELIAQCSEDAYDVAVVVTGDADYERAVQYVQDQGTVVAAAMFTGATWDRFRDAVDNFYPFNEYQERVYPGD